MFVQIFREIYIVQRVYLVAVKVFTQDYVWGTQTIHVVCITFIPNSQNVCHQTAEG